MTVTGAADLADADSLGPEAEAQRERLLAIRAAIATERVAAISPAVERALAQADMYLYLGLGYVGHADDLFPEETTGGPATL